MRLLRSCVIVLTALLMFASAQLLASFPLCRDILLLVWLLVGSFFAGIFLPLYFRNTTYFVSGTTIVKQSGVFFLHKQTMRVRAIQYTTAIHGPFSKVSGLNLLVLNALGGRMLLFFLNRHDMDEILRLLRTQLDREDHADV